MTCRRLDRARIWKSDEGRQHFLKLLWKMTERFQVLLHAYVLMANHYQLFLETPHANASRATQWLNLTSAPARIVNQIWAF